MSYEVKFSYCDTRSTFDRAISGLRSSRVLLLDCEGLDIGMQGGALSLICVGTESAKAIYVFDVPMLRDNGVNVNPLLRLLMREDITKITWDGRMDFLEIYETYGIEMKGVLDLQLAEVMSRKGVRKEGERQRTHRLATRYFGFQAVKTQQELFKGIHIVLGMTQCLKDNNLGEGVEKDPQVVAMHRANGSALWMERPLSERLLRYAATDIYLISLLYEDFLTRGWINRKSTQGLCAYSQEYVSTYQDLGRLDADNVLQKGPLIMLWELEGERKHECSGCGRFKPIECYVTRQVRRMKQRMPRCRVCTVMAIKKNLPDNNEWMFVFDDAE